MLEYAIIIIFLIGTLCMLIPNKLRGVIESVAILGSLVTFTYGIYNYIIPSNATLTGFFEYRNFPSFIVLACAFFCFTIISFSLHYAKFVPQANLYYGLIFWCVSFSMFAVYSSNLIPLMVFWGLSGMSLYLLANLTPQGSNASKKSFVFIGGADAFLILGAASLWVITGSFDIFNIRLDLSNSGGLTKVSFICFAIAALTKAGAMPFHSWIPDFAENVPMSLTAFLPAALDKLLGIYLLVLVTNQLFIMNTSMTFLLLTVGAVTIICAVYMAMVQHDMKRLLAYHAVSQVGYMVLGIASGTALGIAGGVFHMINHAIYKSALFLTGASVEHRTGTTSLDRLGGLARYMPVTFAVCLVAALSISGVPPFNGFASKWMIYQSLIQQSTNPALSTFEKILFLGFLVTAMFGSALTLASFVKLLHSVFLGQPPVTHDRETSKISEVRPTMMLPMVILALLCIIFGVLPYSIPLKLFIYPSLMSFNIPRPEFSGLWQSLPASILIIASLLLGLIIYAVSNIKFKSNRPFMGGEDLPQEAMASGPEFYRSISDMPFFKRIYLLAREKYFDLYDIVGKTVLGIGGFFSFLHTGSLHTYVLMFLLGFAVVIFVLR